MGAGLLAIPQKCHKQNSQGAAALEINELRWIWRSLADGSAGAGDFVESSAAAKSGKGKDTARGGDEDGDVRVERLAGGPPADGSARERDAICAEISGGGREREAGIQDGVVKSSDMPPRSSARLTVQESGPQQFLIPAGPPRCIEYDERNRSAGVGGVRGQGSVFENQPLTFRRASSHGIPADRLKVPRTVQVGFPKDQATKRPPPFPAIARQLTLMRAGRGEDIRRL